MADGAPWRLRKPPPVPVFEEKVTKPVVPFDFQLQAALCANGSSESSDALPMSSGSQPSSSSQQQKMEKEEKVEENEKDGSDDYFVDATPAPASPVTMPGSATEAPSSPPPECPDDNEADPVAAPKKKSKRDIELETRGYKRRRGGQNVAYFAYWSRPRRH